jgi:hypothetical protein
MSGNVILYADTLESLEIPIKTTVDPTGTAPQFGFSSTSAQPSSWVNGAWSGTWSSTTHITTAVTPTLGASGAGLTIAPSTTYTIWIRVVAGTETAKWPVGSITVP